MKKWIFLLVVNCFIVVAKCSAQQHFVEGTLRYSLRIIANNPQEFRQEAIGTYVIKIKGNSVIKEMTLDNGFNSTILYRAIDQAYYSFRKTNNQFFAIQLSTQQMEQKRSNCEKLSIMPLTSDGNAIKNFKTEKARLNCNNTKPIDLSYTKEWSIDNQQLFDEFPSFKFLPLSFSITNADGSVLSFMLDSIESLPLDNSCFDIPKGYKIINQEEYKSWHH